MVGKRVFCSNRHQHTGCGRTTQLYLNLTIRYLHVAGAAVVAFVLSLMAGLTIQEAYFHATGTTTPKNAYRWLHRLSLQLTVWRSLIHQPLLQNTQDTRMSEVALVDSFSAPHQPQSRPRWQPLLSTFKLLLTHFGTPLCAAYQAQLQQSFL